MKRSIAALVLAVAASVVAAAATADVAVRDAWIAEPPPGTPVAAGYLVLANDGDAAVTVTAAESPACERIEFHRMEMDGDVARMRPMGEVVIPAGGSVAFAPGGNHLMLIQPQPLHAGDHVEVTFEFADGAKLAADAEVRKHDPHAHHH